MSTQAKIISLSTVIVLFASISYAFNFGDLIGRSKWKDIAPINGNIELNLNEINDGKAHHYQTKAADGVLAKFFVIMSKDVVMRAAMDACDVCYKAGKGYEQDGDYMVCRNCGQRFHSTKINVIKGGCNPAPLKRSIQQNKLVIAMQDINKNSWYSKYQKE